jgi:spore photoproduct lyase|uniref:DNA photolyase n=1 Tax=Desulfobacca acetoxidans TaxID=60893 RepID=A0A7C5ES28_9BACT
MLRFRRILVETAARDYDMTRRVLARLPGVPVIEIPQREVLRPKEQDPVQWLGEAKTTLLLAVQKGPFWRPCPGTKDYICCGYQVLQVGLNCPFDCTYCILQSYLNLPAVTLFVNVPDLEAELQKVWDLEPHRVWRLGTGEFGDSLALDALSGLNERLLPLFAKQPRAFLEIKSKACQLEHLLPLGPNPQVIFAWSLNPPEMVREAESGTASLRARLKAARQAQDAGFRLAFHFDPLIFFPGWERAYARTVALLGETLSSSPVTWVSLGALRFPPLLRSLIFRRFPKSALAAEEMVRCPDGKLRYFRSLRVEMYGRLKEWLEEALPGVMVYLCMESPRVWREVFGYAPEGEELSRLLDRRLFPV